jgi:cellulose synthase/poly-beta-1,6-N-acetylglucosamine synthase-like glycosyltransferase
MQTTQTLAVQTTVSIGICAVTEIENTLQLTGQILATSDPGISIKELIVATPNRYLARELEGLDKRLVVLLEDKREGKAVAINRIIRRATGDILVLASADIKLGRTSIPRLVHSLTENESWGAVDSRVELVNGDARLMDRVCTLLWEVHNGILDQLDGDDRLGHVAGDLWAVRRDLIGEIPNTINDDAYLALMINRKGSAIHRVWNSLVWIAGPRSPAEYVAQRSRILLGHFHLIRDFKAVPTTFEFTLPVRLGRNMRTLTETVRRLGPSYLTSLFVASFLELVSIQVALVSLLTRRKPRPWRIAHTTKMVRSARNPT